jgi:hypothetical protein
MTVSEEPVKQWVETVDPHFLNLVTSKMEISEQNDVDIAGGLYHVKAASALVKAGKEGNIEYFKNNKQA